jgi:hypothetical protein
MVFTFISLFVEIFSCVQHLREREREREMNVSVCVCVCVSDRLMLCFV